MTSDLIFAEYAEMSVEHRCPTDPDVALVIHEMQKFAELDILEHQGRL